MSKEEYLERKTERLKELHPEWSDEKISSCAKLGTAIFSAVCHN